MSSVFDNAEMYVTKRNGSVEIISFDKILQRLKKMGASKGEWTPKDASGNPIVDPHTPTPTDIKINYTSLAIKIIDQLYDKIPTSKIDEISSEQCACMSSVHPDYGILASRLVVSNHHKTTLPSFSKTIKKLQTNTDVRGQPSPMFAPEYYNIIMQHAKVLDAMCDYSRDYTLDYFAFKTLDRSYLLRSKTAKACERPQHTWLRLAVQIHGTDLEKVRETYQAVSQKYFIHATPSIFNAALIRPQMSSCFARSTLVHTTRGPVPIEQVLTTDSVVTHTGQVQPVTQLHTNRLGERRLLTLQVHKTRPVTVTQDHKMYVYHDPTQTVVWKAVEDLTTDDYIMVPKNRQQPEVSEGAKLQVDAEIMKFFGLWFRYGDYVYADPTRPATASEQLTVDASGRLVSDPDAPVGVTMILPYDDEETIEFCFEKIHRMFGNVTMEKYVWRPDHPHPLCNDGKPRMEVRYAHPPMAHDFVKWFGKVKALSPMFYQYPAHWIRSFFGGWATGGPAPLPDDLYALCRMNHLDHETFLPLDYIEPDLTVDPDVPYRVYEGNTFLQVVSVTDAAPEVPTPDPDTEVYTLGVETDHSYPVEGLVAQNCYLIAMESDSIEGIYNTLKDCAMISKWAGGIGLHIHNIRATGSYIAGTNGTSNGILPMLRVFNHTAKYVDQCVHPDTIIYTTQGPRPIRNLTEGESYIYNQPGGVEVVRQVLEHPYDGEMLTIQTEFSGPPLQITGEHPVYVLPQGETEFQWVEAAFLRPGDQLAVPIPTSAPVPTPVPTPAPGHLTAEDCFFYGLLLDSGSVSHITLMDKPLRFREFVEEYLTQRAIQYRLLTEEPADEADDPLTPPPTVVAIRWDQTTTLVFRENDIFNEAGQRRIHPRWLNQPVEKAALILKGLMEANGVIQKDVYYPSESTELLHGCRFLLLKMGMLSQLIPPPPGSKTASLRIPVGQALTTLLGLDYDGRPLPYTVRDGFMLNPVTQVGTQTYQGTLYDLQMAHQHDYLLSEALVHNGGGKRNGSIAIYIEPWHADIEIYLQMRKNTGDEEMKARDLFYAIWMPDLFMKRVKAGESWTLMCPHECPGLADVYGEAFEELYTNYEREGRGRETVKARDLWFKILDAQMETGTPYLVFKDAANKKSNQKNIGTIKSSNLCVAPETTVLTDQGQVAISTLVGQRVRVWNGKQFSEVEVFQTGHNQPLIEVQVGDRAVHCTPYHKFYIIKDDGVRQTVEAKDLNPGDRLAPCDYPSGYEPPTEPPRVTQILDHGRIDDTYCFTEPLEHAAIFNGIYSGQCSEIIQYSDADFTSVCNLSSIGLPAYIEWQVEGGPPIYNFEKLHQMARVVARNLNRVIDVNYYPTEKTRRSNMRDRPMGIGVQGLADTFLQMGMIFGDDASRLLNKQIFETIYHGALVESCEQAKLHGPYETFPGSPASQGLLQFDLWEAEPLRVDPSDPTSPYRYDWAALKADIQAHGIRNSLLLAPMPTASTSQILGFNECIEPITSNIFTRRTLAGEFVVTNKYLMRDLIQLGLWNEKIKNTIIAHGGSVQAIEAIPPHIREKYKTVWEIPMRTLIDMSADRGIYVCQSQSLNLWNASPNYNSLTSMHFYSWSKGLKTGVYYLRSKAKSAAIQFTIEPEKKLNDAPEEEEEVCEMCSA